VRQPTILDVAELAGVSKSLVSLVMREPERVSESSRMAVLKAVKKLGYRPNAMARSLVQQRSHVIGVVVSDLHNPFFADVADGIEAAAAEAGYRTMLSSGFLDPQRERAALDSLMEIRADGLIIMGSRMDPDLIETVAASVPVVVLGRYTESRFLDSVGVDDSVGAMEAVDYLVNLGHQRVVHIHAGTAAGAPRRLQGYEKAMKSHGLDDYIRSVAGDFTEAGGSKAMTEILGSGDVPTAVFAPNDFSALGAMNVIDSAGLRIPEDISLFGYDNLTIAGLPRIALTTVGQPRAQLGEEAVGLVLERLDEGRDVVRHVVVPPFLVIRSTTGPPRADA